MTSTEEAGQDQEEFQEEEPDYEDVDQNTFGFQKIVGKETKLELKSNFEYMQPMKAQIEFLENPDGSVKLTQGDTCVMAAFYGPSDVRISKELPHRAAVDVFYRPKITGSSKAAQAIGLDVQIEERAMENKIASILETTVYLEEEAGAGYNIILQEYENDGCLFSTCINAAFIACLDGSCGLRSFLAAVTVLVTTDGKLIIHPSSSQQKDGVNGIVTYVLTNSNKVLYMNLQGKAKKETLTMSLQCARLAATEIFAFYETIIRKKYLK